MKQMRNGLLLLAIILGPACHTYTYTPDQPPEQMPSRGCPENSMKQITGQSTNAHSSNHPTERRPDDLYQELIQTLEERREIHLNEADLLNERKQELTSYKQRYGL